MSTSEFLWNGGVVLLILALVVGGYLLSRGRY